MEAVDAYLDAFASVGDSDFNEHQPSLTWASFLLRGNKWNSDEFIPIIRRKDETIENCVNESNWGNGRRLPDCLAPTVHRSCGPWRDDTASAQPRLPEFTMRVGRLQVHHSVEVTQRSNHKKAPVDEERRVDRSFIHELLCKFSYTVAIYRLMPQAYSCVIG